MIRFSDGEEWTAHLFLPEGPWEAVRRIWDGRQLKLREGWRGTAIEVELPSGGCFAFQIDGTEFTDVIEFWAVFQPDPL